MKKSLIFAALIIFCSADFTLDAKGISTQDMHGGIGTGTRLIEYPHLTDGSSAIPYIYEDEVEILMAWDEHGVMVWVDGEYKGELEVKEINSSGDDVEYVTECDGKITEQADGEGSFENIQVDDDGGYSGTFSHTYGW